MISENNKSRILNTLFKAKLLALVEHLVALLERNFLYAFFPDNCSSELLVVTYSEITAMVFYEILRKVSQDQKKTIPCALQVGFSEKNKIFQEKCRGPASVMLTCGFIKTRLQFESVSRNNSTVSGIFICLVSQIIVVAPGQLSKWNWRNTVTVLKTLVKCHNCIKETELFPKSCSRKNCFEKFNTSHMEKP